jgi:hypothetical protein
MEGNEVSAESIWHELGRRGTYMLLVGKPEGKKPLGRSRCRWVDNIEMDLIEIGCCVDWNCLSQIKGEWRILMNAVIKFRVL